ncbi:MAG: hypothetical protein PWQ35_489 [Patescibacteria group bacterium]|nr:hypothetical protein [Patescibacteria group bacterium]
MSQLIIALVGPQASGKEVVKKYLIKKYQAESYKFSQVLRDILQRLYLPQTRENLQNLSFDLRNRFGQDLLANVISIDAQNSNRPLLVIDGVRRLSDITSLKKLNNFKLISLEVETQIRYQRLCARNENEGDKDKTFAQFLEDDNRESEKTIPEVANTADFKIDNNSDLENLYQQIDLIMAKINHYGD